MLLIEIGEEGNEVEGINIIESTVLEMKKGLKVLLLVVKYKIMRRIIHHGQQFQAFVDNRLPLAPCQCSGNKARNFNVLFFAKAVRDGYGVQWDKVRLVVL